LRNDETLQEMNRAMQGIALGIQKENALMASLSLQNHKDTKALKSLTLIATLYLPASLTAVSFFKAQCSSRRVLTQNSDNLQLKSHSTKTEYDERGPEYPLWGSITVLALCGNYYRVDGIDFSVQVVPEKEGVEKNDDGKPSNIKLIMQIKIVQANAWR
jgi:hypothetical protein